ncbi:polysaccharide deacetylase family protein [Sabulicella glaciei]|uniref:Polysaccharide deacetylase family protein n=1 Tax=Sabulicella glaciei TaxID=2984948 RepID=A0ABT3NS33_9PROT|nr:polysaccharide deacetylase family protein [Roseococcus sp. MDT2-1-1]MCW8084979.1 polysaccharide deacetylase family protein [Roseococcus sp. MDT2-1-1]
MRPEARLDYAAPRDRAPRTGPGGARVLVFLVVNVEEWGIDRPMPRQVLSAPTGASVLPDIANWAWHEYGMRVGFWRILRACEALGIRPTLSINGRVCEAYPRVAAAAHAAGWEFMGHGFRQVPTHLVEDQGAMVRDTVAAIARVTGAPPVGWLGPGLTQTLETTDILAAHGIRYCADWVVDDVPVAIRTVHGPIWSMPYSVELNDIPLIMIQHHRAEELQERSLAQLDRLLEEAEEEGCKVMGLAAHPYISGVPHRIGVLERTLEKIAARPGVVFAQGRAILEWWEAA